MLAFKTAKTFVFQFILQRRVGGKPEQLARQLPRTLHHAASLSRRFSTTADGPGLPAHLVYKPGSINDSATLLLVARSAAQSNHADPQFWRQCSLHAQRLLGSDAKLQDLASFAVAAVSVRHHDNELMYNLGDMAASAAQQGLIDGESLVLVLLSHAQLRLRNDRVLRALEAALFELLRQSRATAECLSSSLLSLAEMHVEGCLPQDLDDSSSQSGSRAELIDGAARVALEHLSFFTLPQMCKLLKAFMCFRMRGDRQVSALLLGIGDALGRQPNALTAGDCACAAKAFAVVRVHHERMFATLAGRLRDKDIRGGLTPAELSDVLYGFAKFTSQDTALLDLLSVQVRRHLHALDVSLMSSTLASLAKAGISCPVLTGRAVQMLRRPTVTTAAESQEVTHRHLCDLTQATTAELSALTMAFGKFQVRDSQLYETLADLFMASKSESSDTRAIAILDSPSLINIIHAFAKVHIAPARLFSAILGSLVARPEEELTTRDAVKLLHALAKVDYEMPLGFRQKILRVLGPGGLGELGVFELLKLAAASRKLGVDIDALETQVGAVLPNEPQSLTRESLQRRPAVKKVRRKSARKQKWTW
ncbi:hypothetical protein AK812_SmicGene29689 [Symbiodinium microadriaticum]|uniref:Mitochondrial RNA binding complex 1 subunit n=1 Tax=Symbiodinium microadriaticum TaxID=2951 RepID=A0A1Q9D149_SYMMI|nr:hypothetical protein AK812_SmicGene29689 [Symbiodinium microadriaticum]